MQFMVIKEILLFLILMEYIRILKQQCSKKIELTFESFGFLAGSIEKILKVKSQD